MLPLYLLAAHLVGDFVLQNRWQAEAKLTDVWVRAWHVAGYTVVFIPVVFIARVPWQEAVVFLGFLAALHFATDSRRFQSTFGDWLEWACMSDDRKINEHVTIVPHQTLGMIRRQHMSAQGLKLQPNPWPVTPLSVDQTLHVVQIAVLAGWLLT